MEEIKPYLIYPNTCVGLHNTHAFIYFITEGPLHVSFCHFYQWKWCRLRVQRFPYQRRLWVPHSVCIRAGKQGFSFTTGVLSQWLWGQSHGRRPAEQGFYSALTRGRQGIVLGVCMSVWADLQCSRFSRVSALCQVKWTSCQPWLKLPAVFWVCIFLIYCHLSPMLCQQCLKLSLQVDWALFLCTWPDLSLWPRHGFLSVSVWSLSKLIKPIYIACTNGHRRG